MREIKVKVGSRTHRGGPGCVCGGVHAGRKRVETYRCLGRLCWRVRRTQDDGRFGVDAVDVLATWHKAVFAVTTRMSFAV